MSDESNVIQTMPRTSISLALTKGCGNCWLTQPVQARLRSEAPQPIFFFSVPDTGHLHTITRLRSQAPSSPLHGLDAWPGVRAYVLCVHVTVSAGSSAACPLHMDAETAQ